MAIEQIPKPQLRRLRAESLTATLMQELDQVLPCDVERRNVYEALFKVLYENGAAWKTEEERREFGFEPRDETGWTPSEKVRARQLEQSVMLKMLTPSVLPQGR